MAIEDEDSIECFDQVDSLEDQLADLPVVSHYAKVTKFQCVSKVLKFAIETEQKHRNANPVKMTKTSGQLDPDTDFSTEVAHCNNLDTVSVNGNICNFEKKSTDLEHINSRQQPARSRSFDGFARSMSRSSSYLLGQSLPGRRSLSNRLSKLGNRNKYNDEFSESGDKAFIDCPKLLLNHNNNYKPPIENLFPPKWKYKNQHVALATPFKHSDIENTDVKDMTTTEV